MSKAYTKFVVFTAIWAVLGTTWLRPCWSYPEYPTLVGLATICEVIPSTSLCLHRLANIPWAWPIWIGPCRRCRRVIDTGGRLSPGSLWSMKWISNNKKFGYWILPPNQPIWWIRRCWFGCIKALFGRWFQTTVVPYQKPTGTSEVKSEADLLRWLVQHVIDTWASFLQ